MNMSRSNNASNEQRPIFIIDDDPQWITVLTRGLNQLGWREIRALTDPAYAAQLAAEFEPLLILLDLDLGQRTGLDVLSDLRKLQIDTPVVMVTATNRVDAAVACLQNGAADYLLKPLDRQRLQDCIQRVLKRHEEANKTRELEAQRVANTPVDFETMLQQVEHLPSMRDAPDLLIAEALKRSDGVLKEAAAMIGISSQAICNRRRRAAGGT